VLVALGAAAFVDLAMHLAGPMAAVRVIAYVVSGIGFPRRRCHHEEGMDVRGLNTAATLWGIGRGRQLRRGRHGGTGRERSPCSCWPAIPCCVPLVNAINRIPIDERASEATYYFKLRGHRGGALPDMRDHLVERLEGAKYPVAEINVVEHGDDLLEIVATLVSTAIDPNELNAVVVDLQRKPAFATPPGKSAPRIDFAPVPHLQGAGNDPSSQPLISRTISR
jgi:putative Mg2+ transporter-C (MgtC) family protein